MRRWGVIAGICVVAIVAAVLLAAPSLIAWQLERHLGARPLNQLLEEAARDNANALLALDKPLVLADIPTEVPQKSIAQVLTDAAANLELQGGWRAKLRNAPTVSFLANTVRARASLDVANVGIGTAALEVSVDAIPHLKEQNVVFELALTSAAVEHVSLHGVALPWPVPQVLTDAVQKSLDAINTRLKPVVIAAKVPPKYLSGTPAAAILVNRDAIAVLVGTRLATPKPSLSGKYEDDFIAAARRISPDYRPGTGLIAIAPSENLLPDTSEALRASAVAVNLAMTEALFGIDHSVEPGKINSDLSQLLVASISADHFEREMERIIRNALATESAGILQPAIHIVPANGIELTIKPEDIKAKTIEGALEVVAKGSAKFLDGDVTIDFTLTAWGVLDPSDAGLRARYAVRNFQIHKINANWKDQNVEIKVDHADALASFILSRVKALPVTTLTIPAIAPKLPKPEGDVQIRFQDTNAKIELTGRATLLSPQRVIILSMPVITNKIAVIPGTPVVADLHSALPPTLATLKIPATNPANYPRLKDLFQIAHRKVFANMTLDAMDVGMTRPGLARLMNTYWEFLRPAIHANVSYKNDLTPTEIPAIPGSATCASTCTAAEACGNVAGCKIRVCQTGLRAACRSLCPGGFLGRVNPCVAACDRKADQVCNERDDNECIGRVNSCVTGAGACLAAWTSGLRATCEIAMHAMEAANFKGLAKVSGGATADVAGQTMSELKLAIAPDLSSAGLRGDAIARAKASGSLHIVWTDFGNLLLCTSGTLSAKFDIAAPKQSVGIATSIAWSGGGDTPLKATLTPAKAEVRLTAAEPPLATLVKSNPGLLTCGLGHAVVGLSVVTTPKITQDLLAAALRKFVKDDTGEIIAAVIDGNYKLKLDIKPITFELPSLQYQLSGQNTELKPRLTAEALVYARR